MTKTNERIHVEKPSPNKLKELGVEQWEIWECPERTFPWHYDEKETCYFLEGAVTVNAGGQEVSFGKGDLVSFPAGLDCTWNIKKAVRKYYRFG